MLGENVRTLIHFEESENQFEEEATITAGQSVKLRTVGDKWSFLQSSKFGATAQPFYVLLDNEGYPLEKSYSYDEDVQKFLSWLNSGLERYEVRK